MESVEDDYFHDDPVDELSTSYSLLKFPLKIKLAALAAVKILNAGCLLHAQQPSQLQPVMWLTAITSII